MAEEQLLPGTEIEYTQLTQARVPLDDAAEAFAVRDETGRIPIVVIPQRLNRIRNELVLLGGAFIIGAILVGMFLLNGLALSSLLFVVGVLLLVLGFYRSFMVRIPEGVNGLLARGGRYTRTIGSGTHVIPPWIAVSHLVTRREIPFDVPVQESITKDNVRANVDTLVTFAISDPYKFVYSISADDFDQVFQAACQDGLRKIVRGVSSDEVPDLARHDLTELKNILSEAVEPYGIAINKVTITYAQPPLEFLQSQEARKLATLQQAEQAEKQALAQRRQADSDTLARQRVIAEVEREREVLQVEIQKAEARRRVEELEAEAEELRLAKLEERLAKYPNAAAWETATLRLEVARALAGNTRAVLQLGNASDIARAFIVRDTIQGDKGKGDGEAPANLPPEIG
ncbi:MAG: hypothetical protein Kow0031_04360 [Anaerolineae bacterium]